MLNKSRALRNFFYYFFLLFILIGCKTADKKNYQVPESKLDPKPVYDTLANKTHRVDIVCFIYHRFGDNRYPSTNTSVSLFRKQLKYLRDNNFKIINFSEAVDLVLNNRLDVDKTAVITVDDAFKSFKENAMPLLIEFGYKATIFVNTETVGAGDYMTWEDLKAIQGEGIEIGNHTHSHSYFLNNKNNKINFFRADIQTSRNLIHQNLGIVPLIFAYPYGEFDDELKAEIVSMGFKAAAGQFAGVLYELSDIYAIPRFPINDEYGSMNRFVEKVNTRALRVINAESHTNYKNSDPPVLEIKFNKGDYDIRRNQGFIQNGVPQVKIFSDSLVYVRLTASSKLTRRRTTYTITVPSLHKNQWYWYSHLWINPDIKD
jgi:peptidoglycan/xylan/chitin deacetylase (PgdA/CDA1 family)